MLMKKIDLKGMIESVIEDISSNSSISTFIYKVQLISRYLQNVEFSQWIKNEVDGYDFDDTLPNYRIFSTQVKANLIIQQPFRGILTLTDHTMPIAYLPKDVANLLSKICLRESLISLEDLISKNEVGKLAFSTTEYERSHLVKIYENSTILSAHKSINKSEISLVIHKFKSILLDMFCDFNDNIFNNEIDFNIMNKMKEIDKIISQTINAGVYVADNGTANITDATLVGGHGNNVQISMSNKSELEDIVSKIELLVSEVDNNRTDITDAIFSIREELGCQKPRPRFLRTAFNSLKAIGVGVVANKISPLIDSAIEILNKNLS